MICTLINDVDEASHLNFIARLFAEFKDKTDIKCSFDDFKKRKWSIINDNVRFFIRDDKLEIEYQNHTYGVGSSIKEWYSLDFGIISYDYDSQTLYSAVLQTKDKMIHSISKILVRNMDAVEALAFINGKKKIF